MGASITSDMRGLMREWLATADREYAALGWPTVLSHRPLTDLGRCSCGRAACDTPGAHPASPSWREECTDDTTAVRQRRFRDPDANILVATGHRVDALEAPAPAGAFALDRLERDAGTTVEPVAVHHGRYLFFVDSWHGPSAPVTRSRPGTAPAVRWHAAGSYVLVPPSVTPGGGRVYWLRRPGGHPRPDTMSLVDALVAGCTRLYRAARTEV